MTVISPDGVSSAICFHFCIFENFEKIEGSRVDSNLSLRAAFDAGRPLKLVASNSILRFIGDFFN